MSDVYHNHFSGGAAEYFAASWFLEHGFQVWWPSVQQDAADFSISRGDVFKRVQVKKATWSGRPGSDREYLTIHVNRRGEGRRDYTERDIDFMVAVDGTRLWMVPVKAILKLTNLQLDKRGAPKIIQPERLSYNPDTWRIA